MQINIYLIIMYIYTYGHILPIVPLPCHVAVPHRKFTSFEELQPPDWKDHRPTTQSSPDLATEVPIPGINKHLVVTK